jgi:hypothetical protein
MTQPNPSPCPVCNDTGMVDDGCEHTPGTHYCNCRTCGADMRSGVDLGHSAPAQPEPAAPEDDECCLAGPSHEQYMAEREAVKRLAAKLAAEPSEGYPEKGVWVSWAEFDSLKNLAGERDELLALLREVSKLARTAEITSKPEECDRCEVRNGHLYKCSYHEGWDDAACQIGADIGERVRKYTEGKS